jgi:imidazolonepropionase
MTAAATLVVRNISELVTCDADRGEAPGVVRRGVVAAAGERIVYAGGEAGLTGIDVARDAVEIDAGGLAVVPGFVDAHTHMVWMGDRSSEYALRAQGASYESIAEAGGGIAATVTATAAASLEALVTTARPRLLRAISSGTTTIEVKSGYGIELDAEMRQLDAARALDADAALPEVITTYLPLHGPVRGDRVAFIGEVLDRGLSAARGRARFVDAFCEQGAFDVAECRRVFEAAPAYGLTPRVHAEQRSNSGGAQLAAEVGAASADHLEHATESDLRALAQAGVVGVILPGASLVLGGPPPPGRRLLEAGARVAVATDCNPGTCYSESMPLMVSLAVALAGLTPAQALVAATAGGAAALRLDDRGVLAPGRRCDLAILDSPHWLDVGYHLGAPVVRTVIRGGRVVGQPPLPPVGENRGRP